MNSTSTNLRFKIKPLTSELFERFGEVIEHSGTERRRYINTIYEHSPEAQFAQAWVVRAPECVEELPVSVTLLERHPYSAQTFVPLSPTRMFVFVAEATADGSPDLDDGHAFITAPGQGVSYRPGAWHFKMSPMTPNSQILVLMHATGTPSTPDDHIIHFDSNFSVKCHD